MHGLSPGHWFWRSSCRRYCEATPIGIGSAADPDRSAYCRSWLQILSDRPPPTSNRVSSASVTDDSHLLTDRNVAYARFWANSCQEAVLEELFGTSRTTRSERPVPRNEAVNEPFGGRP